MLDLLGKGMAAGFLIAAPIGPVNMLCVRRTLAGGLRSGLAAGLGAAACDACYGAIAAFSITFVIGFLMREQAAIRLVAGALLVLVGISYLARAAPQFDRTGRKSGRPSDFTAAFLLNLANPTVVLSFLAVLAALGLARRMPLASSAIITAGIFVGSMLWWTVLAWGVDRARDRFSGRVVGHVNRAAGVAIGGFGAAMILMACRAT